MNTSPIPPEPQEFEALEEAEVVVDPVAEQATTVFRIGFRTSATFLIGGIFLTVVRSESLPSRLGSLNEIVPGLSDGSGASFITLGILTMILTPVIATVTICRAFFAHGDQRYGRLAAIVLLVLVLSISLSLR